ncbi:S-methyl-5-thioribose kinase [Fulvimarina sp. MAC3]|uniref:S-methyl-5-thioribose kinase n=1 Tax=Fulvimarina sp. MAC3 TaxID=3148887 RepID=UPI0031FD0D23
MPDSFTTPSGYRVLRADELPSVIATAGDAALHLGGSAAQWHAKEVSDGNMNAVYRLEGPSGSIIVKQALPYIRVIGESWPFPVTRIAFETEALKYHQRIAPQFVPTIIHSDDALGLLVMEDLRHHRVARHAFVDGRTFPHFARQMGAFLAHSLYYSSDFHLSTPEKKALAASFAGNAHLCQTTEDVIFTGPYADRELNRVTAGNETIAAELRADQDLKRAASEMKYVFRTKSEALIHGDLHTGSVMVTEDDTRVIDAEWALHGPMGFDLGALIGNLFLAAISQPGHATAENDRDEAAEWMLQAAADVWEHFSARFLRLAEEDASEFFAPDVLSSADRQAIVAGHLRSVLADAIGFAGAKMIRRIIGISHVEDFERISDVPLRARLESHALRTARRLLLERNDLTSIAEAIAILREEALETSADRVRP